MCIYPRPGSEHRMKSVHWICKIHSLEALSGWPSKFEIFSSRSGREPSCWNQRVRVATTTTSSLGLVFNAICGV
ncbi:hypothetical protein PILCRDRAFT_502627 [Piloderma croceum F 1598]|uniref:Uncharacterized protein n=1 Tax=Piloderma croceum (strain F 1598) TaxID=765440 RepID=A0A0C3FPP0_PILCF|nr:hypothetical protein PILCRDRAFT_502627 [Piloderma croceum F 1598]